MAMDGGGRLTRQRSGSVMGERPTQAAVCVSSAAGFVTGGMKQETSDLLGTEWG